MPHRRDLERGGHRRRAAKSRGVSDAAIGNGMNPHVAAQRILEAVTRGKRELILAKGMEADIARLRRADPDTFFDPMGALMAAGYAQRISIGRRGDLPPG